ncbi:MAG TPA: hypothetical protein VLD36_21540 [Burkholderiales bacterium]|jgi:hypothetical protein|nr:hypothetical protein [Burkholderiales bacterium]
MITTSIAIPCLALLAGGALALLSVPVRADADTEPTDRHEIPTFVLERVELATEEYEGAWAASQRAAHTIPAHVETTGMFR